MVKVFVGRVVKNVADRSYSDKNGEIRFGVSLAVNNKDGSADFYEFSVKSEKLAKCLTKGKMIAVGCSDIIEKKSKDVNGREFVHKYLQDAALSFVPVKSETTNVYTSEMNKEKPKYESNVSITEEDVFDNDMPF